MLNVGVHRLDRGDVAQTQCLALTDHSFGILGNNRRLAILAEGRSRIMHDRAVVIVADVIAVGNLLVEVVLKSWDAVLKLHGDELCAIFAALFVPYSLADAAMRSRATEVCLYPTAPFLWPGQEWISDAAVENALGESASRRISRDIWRWIQGRT